MSNIDVTIHNMKHDENQAKYFFSQSLKYPEKLHLWLEPLFNDEAGFLSLNENNEFKYGHIPSFLETIAIQNKEQEKSEVTKRLLSIANEVIKTTTDDYIVYSMVKIIFNLPPKKITLKHIKFIGRHIKTQKDSLLNYELGRIILPVLIEHKMRKHLAKLLRVIFGYQFQKEILSYKDPVSIIEQYNLQELLQRHSKNIIKLTGVDGLEIVIDIAKKIISKQEGSFNIVGIRTIRIEKPDEKQQNQFSDGYENQLIFFIRDFLENLPVNKIKPYISHFLLKEKHSIWHRLALHIINCKYADLKDIFWQWMDIEIEYRKEYELWVLLNESSAKFKETEFNKIIVWIEGFDCKKHLPDEDEDTIKKCSAYRRKTWLLCLKDNSSKANKLYQKYHLINGAKIQHPGFGYWSSGAYRDKDLNPIENLCENKIKDIISKIKDFAPDLIEKKRFTTNNDLIDYVANDLSTCVKANPQKFSAEIANFHQLDYAYKRGLIQGFKNAWNDKQKFDWGKVLDFIFKELTPDFFIVNKKNKHYLISEITDLIKYGTPDENAFDKKHLPVAKNILLKLIENKEHENEDDITNNLGNHVLNSNNGKALHALIHYALRYGRLHSTKKVKWEKEIKDFFTQQLSKNDVYSKSVFTILGTYLSQLHFLDGDWVEKNFNKIFPLENEALWEISIEGYFFHVNTVYEDIYKLFLHHKYIDKALSFNFSSNHIKLRIISFVSIAYLHDIDSKTAITIIESENQDNIIKIIQSISQVYRDTTDEKILKKIKFLWRKIYDEHQNKDAKNIFRALVDWLIFVKQIDKKDMEILKHIIKNIKTREHSSFYQVINLFNALVDSYPEKIGKLYLAMLKKDVFFTYNEEDVIKIVETIKQTNQKIAQNITNKYIDNGMYFLKDI